MKQLFQHILQISFDKDPIFINLMVMFQTHVNTWIFFLFQKYIFNKKHMGKKHSELNFYGSII